MRSIMKRRGAFFALLLVLALVAAACSSSDSDSDSTETTVAAATETTVAAATDTTVAAATETTVAAASTTVAESMAGEGVTVGMAYDIGGRGDKSFNDSAAAGLDKATTDFGIESNELEPSGGGENREENLRLLAESGLNPVFAIGFAFADGVAATAADFPDTSFAIVDSVVDLPNVASLVFAEHEGSALVGAAAALKTQTGTIGFVGGVAGLGLIEKFQAGYEAGALEANPDVTVLVQYLTEFPDFAGFTDPAKGKEAALAMYEEGADVVYHAAGGSGAGVFEAAKDTSETTGTKVWAIGVDSDQYLTAGEDVQEYILTSMLKRVDVAVYSTINNFVTDSQQSGVVVFDLAADGVAYSTSGGFVDDIVDQLDALRESIIKGDFVVPDAPAEG
ncbi:MAG: BMP family ABC transporter substrate-binding protein [Actinomycetia bacterium]|nr:BMP family ABC transporter substrate-binding protein [Actinomycetes bacterium]